MNLTFTQYVDVAKKSRPKNRAELATVVHMTNHHDEHDTSEVRRGRPRVGAPRGESPVAKGRVTKAEFDELTAIMDESGRTQSELVRRGVQLVIQEHRATGDRATNPEPGDPA